MIASCLFIKIEWVSLSVYSVLIILLRTKQTRNRSLLTFSSVWQHFSMEAKKIPFSTVCSPSRDKTHPPVHPIHTRNSSKHPFFSTSRRSNTFLFQVYTFKVVFEVSACTSSTTGKKLVLKEHVHCKSRSLDKLVTVWGFVCLVFFLFLFIDNSSLLPT